VAQRFRAPIRVLRGGEPGDAPLEELEIAERGRGVATAAPRAFDEAEHQLRRHVVVARADATALPFARARFDACLSQEAFLHIADKATVLGECRRVLRPGGRLAFTDWIARPRLGDLERQRLREWMAAMTLPTIEGYRHLLGRAGFTAVEAEDLSDEWRPILRRRLEMYRALRDETIARFGEQWYRDYQQVYGFFVGLVEDGKLGGGRFSGTS